ncbi:hypothetical protein P692DRAFT_20752014 [Suillus brevipes Sb2]|nr:hypothetical protein P692DRAFT_20752014 [Suillus brevipes Sb2]
MLTYLTALHQAFPRSRSPAVEGFVQSVWKLINLNHLLHVRISSSHDTTRSLLSLQSRATRPPVGYCRPPISDIRIVPRPPPIRDPQHPAFPRLTKLLHFSRANVNAVPVGHIRPRDPLDVCFLFLHFIFHSTLALQFPATSPLLSNRVHGENAPSTSFPGGSTFFDPTRPSSLGQATYVCYLHVR